MGTDIHGVIEVWDRKVGIWVPGKAPMFEDRCYLAFAILAGIRNEWGIKPLAADRGLPSEGFPNRPRDPDSYDYGDHSFSHIYYPELATIDWSQPVLLEGFAERSAWIQWYERGGRLAGDVEPEDWCKGAAGGGVFITDFEDMVSRMQRHDWMPSEAQIEKQASMYGGLEWWPAREKRIRAGQCSFYGPISFIRTWGQWAHTFKAYIEKTLKPLADQYGEASVRMVFGFDS